MPAATFDIDYQRHGDGLRARFRGGDSALDTLVACWMQVAQELRREPAKALLMAAAAGAAATLLVTWAARRRAERY